MHFFIASFFIGGKELGEMPRNIIIGESGMHEEALQPVESGRWKNYLFIRKGRPKVCSSPKLDKKYGKGGIKKKFSAHSI
jgi:hypothetical protein